MSKDVHSFKCSCVDEHVHDPESLRKGVEVTPGTPHRLVVGALNRPWIELEVHLPEGVPAAGLAFRCRGSSGIIDGRLDQNGRARIEGVDEKESHVEFLSIPRSETYVRAKDDIDG